MQSTTRPDDQAHRKVVTYINAESIFSVFTENIQRIRTTEVTQSNEGLENETREKLAEIDRQLLIYYKSKNPNHFLDLSTEETKDAREVIECRIQRLADNLRGGSILTTDETTEWELFVTSGLFNTLDISHASIQKFLQATAQARTAKNTKGVQQKLIRFISTDTPNPEKFYFLLKQFVIASQDIDKAMRKRIFRENVLDERFSDFFQQNPALRAAVMLHAVNAYLRRHTTLTELNTAFTEYQAIDINNTNEIDLQFNRILNHRDLPPYIRAIFLDEGKTPTAQSDFIVYGTQLFRNPNIYYEEYNDDTLNKDIQDKTLDIPKLQRTFAQYDKLYNLLNNQRISQTSIINDKILENLTQNIIDHFAVQYMIQNPQIALPEAIYLMVSPQILATFYQDLTNRENTRRNKAAAYSSAMGSTAVAYTYSADTSAEHALLWLLYHCIAIDKTTELCQLLENNLEQTQARNFSQLIQNARLNLTSTDAKIFFQSLYITITQHTIERLKAELHKHTPKYSADLALLDKVGKQSQKKSSVSSETELELNTMKSLENIDVSVTHEEPKLSTNPSTLHTNGTTNTSVLPTTNNKLT